MDRESAIMEVRSRWKEFYPADKGSKGIICPLCGNGSGKDGTGIRENPKSNKACGLKCFKCGFSGDIIDLLQEDKGINFNEALQYAAGTLHLTIENGSSDPAVRISPAPERSAGERRTGSETAAASAPDKTAYYAECAQRRTNPAAASYLAARGISPALQELFNIGFDPVADPGGKGHPAPRIIIPVTSTHYVGRSIDPNTPKDFKKMNNKGATTGIFNEAALYDPANSCVFVVEGVFDALSIMEAGGVAIALNSTSNVKNRLLERLEQKRTSATLLINLDTDEAGRKAAQELKTGLGRLNISYASVDVNGGYKDANEYLTADRKEFIDAVARAEHQATAIRPDNTSSYIDLYMDKEINLFKEGADRRTGFRNLDDQAGGLYSGLYCIAATSSLGKTTFALQLADNLAAAGNEVLFFSLEQSRFELVSKSLARITAQNDIKTAVNSLSIRRGHLPGNVLTAADDYKHAVGERMNIIEGNFNCTVPFIGEYTHRHIKKTDRKPIIFVDYLQILQGDPDKRQTTKELVDTTVTKLKRLSRELNTAIFVISSVNRANYMVPIDFEALKESGNIEYTCDVVWGLQLQCLNDPLFEGKEKIKEKREKIREAKAAIPRKIELLCLKNRYGIANYSCYFDYYPQYDLFMPGEAEEDHPKRKRV